MRVILIGSGAARTRLRAQLAASIEILAEYPTLGAARGAGLSADAYLLAREDDGEPDPLPEALTARERQVLDLLAEGLPNKAIASRLGISDQTVKFHIAAIIGKLGAANRTDAVRLAVRNGLVSL